jgi:hypothetical protein
MSTRFVVLADSGEEVAATEARDQAEETDALRILTAKALQEAKLLGVELNLVAAWPDCAVRVGRVEGDKVTWALGADEGWMWG